MKVKIIKFITCFFILGFMSCEEQKSGLPDPYEAGWKGEKVCEILEDNDRIRVLRCTFPPGVGHEKHEHQPHFGYTLIGGKFKIEDAKGVREVNIPNGYSFSNPEGSIHQVQNIGDSTSVYLIVEYK